MEEARRAPPRLLAVVVDSLSLAKKPEVSAELKYLSVLFSVTHSDTSPDHNHNHRNGSLYSSKLLSLLNSD